MRQDDSRAHDAQYEWLQTPAGDRIIPAINARHFTNRANAQAALREHFGNDLHGEDRLFVVIGSDSGQLIRFVQEHNVRSRGTRWIFIEPEIVHNLLQDNPDVTRHLDDYVRLITPDRWEEEAGLLQLVEYFKVEGVKLRLSLGAIDDTTPDYAQIASQIDADLLAKQFQFNITFNPGSFLRPQILCAPTFEADVGCLRGRLPQTTAVVIAGGPSLDKQIDWLTANRDLVLVIAVSRVSRRLQQAGVTPDILVTVDPTDLSLAVSTEMFDFPSPPLLITSNHPYPPLLNRWPGKTLHAGNRIPWDEPALNPTRAFENAGPTVTHVAARLAAFMGSDRVVFLGLDLCHSPEGQTHASGSSEAEAGPLMDFSAIPVTTNTGGRAWTSPDYYSGIGAMSHIAAEAQGVEFINPAEHGAAIEGVGHCTLAEVPLPLTALDKSVLADVMRGKQPDERREDLETLLSTFESMASDLEKVGNLGQLGLESNRAYFNLTHPERQKRHKRRMAAIDRLLRAHYPNAFGLVQRGATRAILRSDLPHDFFDLDEHQAETLANRYYGAISQEARRLIKPIEQASEWARTRLMELAPQPDTGTIIERYLEFDEPERALWLERHHDLPGDATRPANELYDQRIQALLEKNDRRNMDKRSPQAAIRQIERLYSHKEQDALERLARSIDARDKTDGGNPYSAYATGLLEEEKGNLAEAAETYITGLNNASPEQDTLLIERILLRLARVYMEGDQSENAVDPLEMAAKINPTHWRLVARLALLQNDAERGIDALGNHLKFFPGDIERIKQMVRLFVALEITDGIDFCEQYLSYCTPADRVELESFLAEARQTLGARDSG